MYFFLYLLAMGSPFAINVLPSVFHMYRNVGSLSSIIIVVSPLNALMKDQVNTLTVKRIHINEGFDKCVDEIMSKNQFRFLQFGVY